MSRVGETVYEVYKMCFVQLRPEVSSVSEDGRLYELVVESTVPVPCLEESTSSTEQCTLSLQLSTSSKGEDLRQDNDTWLDRFSLVVFLPAQFFSFPVLSSCK